jgi:hypothetical protein
MKMIDFNDGEIDSIRRTWNNLKAEASGHVIKNDDKSLRYNALVHWIDDLKVDEDDVTVTADMLTEFMIDFNRKHKGVYNTKDIKIVRMDLDDIFDVTKKSGTGDYMIGRKWSLGDIRGMIFT